MKKRTISKLFGVILLSIVAMVTFVTYAAEGEESLLRVSYLDIGQGDATLIEAPNGVQVLIDGGVSGSVLSRELAQVMPFWDRSIDVVIATHPDQDHIGGLPTVFERFEVAVFIESGAQSDTDLDEALLEAAQEAEHVIARRGQRLWLDEEAGVYLDILYPDTDMSDEDDPNDASIAARLVYGESEFLFTGDAPKRIEEYLVWLDSDSVEADVLKAGHHGSRTSTGEHFVGWVQPEYAVISAGEDNRYGHPHQEVLETLEQFDVAILSTAESGTITITTNGITIDVQE